MINIGWINHSMLREEIWYSLCANCNGNKWMKLVARAPLCSILNISGKQSFFQSICWSVIALRGSSCSKSYVVRKVFCKANLGELSVIQITMKYNLHSHKDSIWRSLTYGTHFISTSTRIKYISLKSLCTCNTVGS